MNTHDHLKRALGNLNRFADKNKYYFLGFPVSLFISYLLSIVWNCLWHIECGMNQFYSFAYTLAGVVAYLYTVITFQLRQKATEQNNLSNDLTFFTVCNEIHDRLSGQRSYKLRRYLYRSFTKHLAEVAKKVLGAEFLSESGDDINVKKVMGELHVDSNRQRRFNAELDKKKTGIDDVTALEAAEWVLLDFDLLALPVFNGSDSAKKIALMYEPVLKGTFGKLCPFIAIQMRLRGEASYKKHYLQLLQELEIRDLASCSDQEKSFQGLLAVVLGR